MFQGFREILISLLCSKKCLPLDPSQTTPSHHAPLTSILILFSKLCLRLRCGLFRQDFTTKILYVFLMLFYRGVKPSRSLWWKNTDTECPRRKCGKECMIKGKGKVVPVIFLKLSTTPWRRIGEWRYRSTHSLTSALDGSEWSASRPGRFIPRERAPGTHWIGGWAGPRAILDAMVKRKIPSPQRESNSRTPIVQGTKNTVI
jgi:hypothetical protein